MRGAVQARGSAAVRRDASGPTAAVLVERDTIAQLRLSIVDRELERARARGTEQPASCDALQRTLVHEAAILDARRRRRRQTLTSGGAVAPPGGCVNTPFVPHGGAYGFFRRPGPTTPSTRSRSSPPGSTSSARRCNCI